MKKSIPIMAGMFVIVAGLLSAPAMAGHVSIGVNIGVPGVYMAPPPMYAPPPPPVYVRPAPVYYVNPPPVYVERYYRDRGPHHWHRPPPPPPPPPGYYWRR